MAREDLAGLIGSLAPNQATSLGTIASATMRCSSGKCSSLNVSKSFRPKTSLPECFQIGTHPFAELCGSSGDTHVSVVVVAGNLSGAGSHEFDP